MSDILRALLISTGILFPVVVLIIIVGRAVVLRGEAALHADVHPVVAEPGLSGGAAAAAKPAVATAQKTAVAATEEISVLEILGMGVALFVVAVILLFGISIIRHM